MNKKLLSILFGSALVLSACGGGGEEGATDDAHEGNQADTEETEDTGDNAGGTVDTAAAEQAFTESCAACHGADLSGGAGPNLTKVGSKYSKDEILNIIKEGKGTMPGGQATGEKAELIAEWLATKK